MTRGSWLQRGAWVSPSQPFDGPCGARPRDHQPEPRARGSRLEQIGEGEQGVEVVLFLDVLIEIADVDETRPHGQPTGALEARHLLPHFVHDSALDVTALLDLDHAPKRHDVNFVPHTPSVRLARKRPLPTAAAELLRRLPSLLRRGARSAAELLSGARKQGSSTKCPILAMDQNRTHSLCVP